MDEYREIVRNSKDFNEDSALTMDRSALQNEIIETVVPNKAAIASYQNKGGQF